MEFGLFGLCAMAAAHISDLGAGGPSMMNVRMDITSGLFWSQRLGSAMIMEEEESVA